MHWKSLIAAVVLLMPSANWGMAQTTAPHHTGWHHAQHHYDPFPSTGGTSSWRGSYSHFPHLQGGYWSHRSRSLTLGYGYPGTFWMSGSYRPYPVYYPPHAGYYPSRHYHYHTYDYWPHGIYYNPQANYVDYYLPPIYVPAELLGYGPQAFYQFLGLNRLFGVRNVLPAAAAGPVAVELPAAQAARGALVEQEPVAVRPSNAAARDRSRRFIQFGDALFAQQRYHEALQRYKSAASAAADLAEPHFRQGHALLATGRYDLAEKAFRRALQLADDLERDGFELDQLYGQNQIAKQAHLEGLAQTILEQPADADKLFLLGISLYYDGQPERADVFFQRAAELAAADRQHVDRFLIADDGLEL